LEKLEWVDREANELCGLRAQALQSLDYWSPMEYFISEEFIYRGKSGSASGDAGPKLYGGAV